MKQMLVALLSTTILIASSVHAQAPGVTPVPIPSGFDFPADEATLLVLRDTDAIAKMRLHAWQVFAGMTQPTPAGEAIWETWHSSEETFRSGPALQGVRKTQRNFRDPRQFGKVTPGPTPQAIGASLLSFVLLNPDAHKHIRTQKLYLQSELTKINDKFNKDQTPVPQRVISPFPRTAVVLKTVWWLVRKQSLTALPVWDNDPANPDSVGNDYPTWKRVVAVDPSRNTIPAGEIATVNLFATPRPNSRVVSLQGFYHFQISAAELPAITRVRNFQNATVGDYAVLVALHYTTKEIPDWVWATFWWHDQPNNGAFAADRPGTVSGVWRNYLMDVAYSGETPKEADGTPSICFNPWLEARFRMGMTSNCMACHQRSIWQPVSFLPVTRGTIPPGDQFFAGNTQLDFLWSIGFESK